MSENYEYRSITPPRYISQEERQRQQIQEAVNAAIRDNNIRNQQTIAFINQKHKEELNLLNAKIEKLEGDTRERAKMRQIQFAKLHKENSELRKQQEEVVKILREHQDKIDSMVAEYRSDKAHSITIRKKLIDECKALIDQIGCKNHEKFVPGELETIMLRVSNMSGLPDDAAISILHVASKDLNLLENKIEQAKKKFDDKLKEVIKESDMVLAEMSEKKKTITFVDQNNNIIYENGDEYRVDFDFWTGGEYGRLEEELLQIKDDLFNGYDNPNFTLKTIETFHQRIKDIDIIQKELVLESIERGNSSMIREDTAKSAIEKLRHQGFETTECGFEKNDKRKAFFAKLTNGSSKLLLVVNPLSELENQVIIETVETRLNEHQLNLLQKDIESDIMDNGYTISSSKCSRSNPFLNEIYEIDFLSNEIPVDIKRMAGLGEEHKKVRQVERQ